MEGQLVTTIATEPQPPAFRVGDCIRALKRGRCEREHAAVQDEIHRLQQRGNYGPEMDALFSQKHDLSRRIEELR
jgi:hypothetical protein